MPDPVRLIPLDAIDEAALLRDRAAACPDALMELQLSIAASGLRMPVEVFELAEPDGAQRYGLISGFRRLAALRALHAGTGQARFAEIPAFIRTPDTVADAMTAMVEENAIRAEISAWEQASVAVAARDRGLFDTVDAAVEALYSRLGRDKRRRLRLIAQLVEETAGLLAAPETIPQARLLRLAAAVARGYGAIVRHALEESRAASPEDQWRLLLGILAEAEHPEVPDPAPDAFRRDRPRRTWSLPRHRMRIRREMTRDGWCLHFTGRDATGEFMDTVFDYIEDMFAPK